MLFKIFVFLFFTINSFGAGFPYYYYDIKNTHRQKKAFINILLPMIKRANKNIEKERDFIKYFFENAGKNSFRELDEISLAKLIHLFKKYKIKNLFDKDEYLRKIDAVPASLAIAQAAVESAWGKSRFVLEANNIFGHWTYSGKGLVPIDRAEGKTHTLRIFKTLQASVNAYVLNLNSNAAYKMFRKLRENAHKNKMIFNGLMASKAMINYSQRKEKYVKLLDAIITSNNLLYYDYKATAL
ncbi:MAG: glucosaminidase domain-containing protein [Sulfurospirillum sp.]